MDAPTFHHIDLCSGSGMLSLSLQLVFGLRVRTVCYVEREARAAATLVARMADAALDRAPVWDDVTAFNGKPWRGLVEIISAGYPCQPFSFAGKRHGENDPRHLWPHIARIIGEAKPRFVFLENVSGHLTLGFQAVRSDLQAMGYRVASGLFEAAEVGASHKRQRLFALAHDDSDGCCDDGHTGRHTAASDRYGLGKEQQGPSAWAGDLLDMVGAELPAGPQSLSLFAPHKDDFALWRRVMQDHAEYAPALPDAEAQSLVRGVADGLANRVDRLRLCGNGVVPLQVAYAFVSLFASLFFDPGSSAGNELT